MKVAIVHDFLVEYGGAERVVQALHEIFPDAPIYTAFFDKKKFKNHPEVYEWKVKTSWAQYLPFFKSRLYSPLRFLAPYIWKSFNFKKYDLVISSTNMYFAKNISVPNGVHISYIHTPPRSLYGYATARNWDNGFVRLFIHLINHFLRIKDFQAAQKPDYLLANSKEVARRIKKFYRRDSTVIYPPVNLPESLEEKAVYGKYFLMVGRLAFSKRVHIGIKAAKLAGVQLKIVGTGTEEEYLKKYEDKNIQLLGHVGDQELAKLYRNCRAVLFLAKDEDFGIVPVEAMGYGKPVIAARSGGVKETVTKTTGILINEPIDEHQVAKVLENFNPTAFDPVTIRKHAKRFSKERFKKEIRDFIWSKKSKIK